MRLFVLLADDARLHVARSVGPSCHVLPECGPDDALSAIGKRECDALIIDPSILASDVYERVLEAIATTAVPVLLYTPLTALGAQRVLQIEAAGPHELLLRGIDDDPLLICRKLASLPVPTVSTMLLSRAAKRLSEFPESLRTASVALFGSGPLPRWVDELAATSGFARRTVDRWMHRTGLNGSSALLDVARLSRAWEPLAEHGRRPTEVSEELGYPRMRLFLSHARHLVHATPAEIGQRLSREEFTARLSTALLER